MAPWMQHVTNESANGAAQLPALEEAECQRSSSSTSEVTQVPLGRKLSVIGQVWALSRDANGCREVQDAMEMAQSDEDCVAIAHELSGHVWEAVCCPHANYVLQKCIVKMRSKNSQFIIDELLQVGRVGQAARHKYGCRVLQRILEHCRADQVKPLVDELLAEALQLSKHPYASFVMQHIFEQGSDEQVDSLMEVLVANAVTLGADGWACVVLHKAFVHGDLEGQLKLASAILQDKGLIARIARSRRGHPAAKLILDLFEEGSPERANARAQLRDEEAMLRKARYGRSICAVLAQEGSSCDDA